MEAETRGNLKVVEYFAEGTGQPRAALVADFVLTSTKQIPILGRVFMAISKDRHDGRMDRQPAVTGVGFVLMEHKVGNRLIQKDRFSVKRGDGFPPSSREGGDDDHVTEIELLPAMRFFPETGNEGRFEARTIIVILDAKIRVAGLQALRFRLWPLKMVERAAFAKVLVKGAEMVPVASNAADLFGDGAPGFPLTHHPRPDETFNVLLGKVFDGEIGEHRGEMTGVLPIPIGGFRVQLAGHCGLEVGNLCEEGRAIAGNHLHLFDSALPMLHGAKRTGRVEAERGQPLMPISR